MELEEAKKQCEHIIKFYTDLDTIYSKKKKCSEIRAIETLLQALDNSIPKEKVIKKIQELKKIAKKKDIIPETVKEEKLDGSYIYSQRFNIDGYIAEAIVKVLQELLEEK